MPADQRVPAVELIGEGEQLAGMRAEAVDELGIELRAASGAEHLDRSIHPADPMQGLHVVGHMDDPHDPSDLVARQPGGRALAIPALERLLQRVAHLGTESESQRQVARGLTVTGHRLRDLL